MSIKFISKKIVALSLIISPMVQTYISLNQVLFVLPKISFVGDPVFARSIYNQLLQKAVVISLGLFANSFYGFSLLIKPLASTKYIHILLGIAIFVLSTIVFRISAINQIINQLHFLPIVWNIKLNRKPIIKPPSGLRTHFDNKPSSGIRPNQPLQI